MKNRVWMFQIPIALLATFALYVDEAGVRGELHDAFLRNRAFPVLRTVTGWFTNLKFHARGPEKPRNKIVIVEVDNESLSRIGRWPWHRDATAWLIHKVFESGAKVVGLDMVFSEEDRRTRPELAELLTQQGLGHLIDQYETDQDLKNVISAYKTRLVTGWTAELACQPAYSSDQACPINEEEVLNGYPLGFEKFAYSRVTPPAAFDQKSTSLLSVPFMLANLPMYNEAALHSGYFNAWPDQDGYIRRTNLVMTAKGRAYPSLPLEMARVGLGDELELKLGSHGKVVALNLSRSGRTIETSPLGVMEVNFRGPSFTFPYIPAWQLLQDELPEELLVYRGRSPASESRGSLLKDAYVLIGISALGVHDMRAFPFESNTPGVEGHANILDNLLSGDMIRSGSGLTSPLWLFMISTVGALVFAYFTARLESVPALLLFIFVMSGLGALDLQVLFRNNINWNTGPIYIELFSMFMFTVAVKYVLEEKNKKFIRGAFAKYVAPAIVDSILKDPAKLTVGGEKRDMTIMFSDIRSFTTFSERMDAKQLAGFLNDYLGIMTDIVFDHDGTLDKYIGDAVMAFWGAPLNQPLHAANACKAAIRMQQALSEHRQRFKDQYGIDVNVGIGLNTGPVNVGNMGSDRIFEYTVIGDHVNLASRLEGLTKYYGVGIVTTRFTLDAIKDGNGEPPPHRVLDFVKVKGKKNSVELIHILERQYPADGLLLFEEGRQLYRNQLWDQAIEKFKQAGALLRAQDEVDAPTEMYVERCKEFKLNPPDADWDGSWEMTSK